MLRKKVGALVLFAAALGANAESRGPAVHTVVIDGMRFIPETLEVRRGDTVIWRNKDPFPHTATAITAGGGPASPDIAAGGSWSFKAAKQGRHAYLCTLHRTMRGTLVVK